MKVCALVAGLCLVSSPAFAFGKKHKPDPKPSPSPSVVITPSPSPSVKPSPLPSPSPSPKPSPSPVPSPSPSPSPKPSVQPSPMPSQSPNVVQVRVKFVSAGGKVPRLSQSGAITDVENINKLYAQCGIKWVYVGWESADFPSKGLPEYPKFYSDLPAVKRPFDDRASALVVITGNFQGELAGSNGMIRGWSTGPNDNPFGSVMSDYWKSFANGLAHELAHTVGLPHVNDSTNIMSPVIGTANTKFYPSQCTAMRSYLAGSLKRITQF